MTVSDTRYEQADYSNYFTAQNWVSLNIDRTREYAHQTRPPQLVSLFRIIVTMIIDDLVSLLDHSIIVKSQSIYQLLQQSELIDSNTNQFVAKLLLPGVIQLTEIDEYRVFYVFVHSNAISGFF